MTLEQINTFTPFGNAILVHSKKVKQEKTESGIIMIQDKTSIGQRPSQAEVVAIGPEVEGYELGDTIHFEQTSGYDLLEDDENWYILLDSDRVHGKTTNK